MTPCLPGKFASTTGQEVCAQCPISTFSEDEATVNCQNCPAFTETSAQGANSRQQCYCLATYYSPTLANGIACITCTTLGQATCVGGQQPCVDGSPGCGSTVPIDGAPEYIAQVTPRPRAGTFQQLDTALLIAYAGGTDLTATLRETIEYQPLQGGQSPFYQCSLAESCLGGAWWELYESKTLLRPSGRGAQGDNMKRWINLQCAPGYYNAGADVGGDAQQPLMNTAPCSSCDAGHFGPRYFKKDDRCEACGSQTVMIILILIFLVFLVILAYYASKTNFSFAAISISINFFQVAPRPRRPSNPSPDAPSSSQPDSPLRPFALLR